MSWKRIEQTLYDNGITVDLCTLCAYVNKAELIIDYKEIDNWLMDMYDKYNDKTRKIIIELFIDYSKIKEVIYSSFSRESVNIGFQKARFAKILVALSEFGENPSENYVIMSDCLDEFCEDEDMPKFLNNVHNDKDFDFAVEQIKRWLTAEHEFLNSV